MREHYCKCGRRIAFFSKEGAICPTCTIEKKLKARICSVLYKVAHEFKRVEGLTPAVVGLEKAQEIIRDLEAWEKRYENIGPYGPKAVGKGNPE